MLTSGILKPIITMYFETRATNLQFLQASFQDFVLGELVIIVQALWVQECAAGLDNMTRDDLFDWKLDFLEVDSCLG